jgi:hypothetical protein
MSLNNPPKPNTEQSLIDAFLKGGGKVTKGKTKPMASELGISNNSWNQKLTKDEKAAKSK